MIGDYKWAKLYIEGIQVPLADASVTCSVNGFNVCNFSIVPTEKAMHFEYRSIVQLFVYDQNIGDFVYLFEGEIVSRGYNFGYGSSAVQYTAISFHHYLAQILMSFVEPAAMNNAHTNMTMGVSLGTTIPTGPVSHFNMLRNAGKQGKSLSEVLQLFIKDTYDNSTAYNERVRNCKSRFYHDRAKALSLIPGGGQERYYVAESGSADELFGMKTGESVLNSMEQHITAKMSRWDVLQQLMSLMMYDCVSPVGSVGNNMIFKPNAYFVNPPACNILFPNMVSTFNYVDPMDIEPTRLVGSANGVPHMLGPDGKPGTSIDLWYSADTKMGLQKNIYEFYKKMKDKTPLGDYFDSSSPALETPLEAKYGQKMQATPIQYSRILAPFIAQAQADGETKKHEDFIKLFANMLQYEFHKLKYMPKSGSFSGPFNFSITPGFPVLLMKGAHKANSPESMMAFVGYLSSVTHVVSCSSGITTSGSMNCIRTAWAHDEEGLKPIPWLGEDSSSPVKEAFADDKINGTYDKMLGCKSLKGITGENMAGSATKLFKQFAEGMTDEKTLLEFTRKTTYRPIATLKSIISYYGLSRKDAEYTMGSEDEESLEILEGKIYTSEFKSKVKDYMDELKGTRILLGL